jgi:hypothetical protein
VAILFCREVPLLGWARIGGGILAYGSATAILYWRTSITEVPVIQTSYTLLGVNLLLVIITRGHPGRVFGIELPPNGEWTVSLEKTARRQALVFLALICIGAFIVGWVG